MLSFVCSLIFLSLFHISLPHCVCFCINSILVAFKQCFCPESNFLNAVINSSHFLLSPILRLRQLNKTYPCIRTLVFTGQYHKQPLGGKKVSDRENLKCKPVTNLCQALPNSQNALLDCVYLTDISVKILTPLCRIQVDICRVLSVMREVQNNICILSFFFIFFSFPKCFVTHFVRVSPRHHEPVTYFQPQNVYFIA